MFYVYAYAFLLFISAKDLSALQPRTATSLFNTDLSPPSLSGCRLNVALNGSLLSRAAARLSEAIEVLFVIQASCLVQREK